MLTIKIRGSALRMLCWAVVCIATGAGCGPPGPRALVQGERLVRQGKYHDAVEKLQRATQLLPKNALAWNHLGLAYHGNNQSLLAIRAYRQALALDNKMVAVRFNLGCVYLDQNELPLAIEQLTSYTYLQPNVTEGWMKLGTAQLRAGHLDLAEKNFKTALELQPDGFEPLNGLGLVQFQKRRYSEAMNSFNLAFAQNPKYSPALLNAAIAAHQLPSSRQNALQLYRQYLALKPPPDDFEKITTVANQLEAELNPVRPPVIASSRVVPPKTSNIILTPNPPTRVSNVLVAASNGASARTNEFASLPPIPKAVARSNAFALTNLPVLAPVPKAFANDPVVEVTRVDEGFVIKPPQDLSTNSGPMLALQSNELRGNPKVVVAPEKTAKPPTKGFLTHLNPFSPRPKASNSSIGPAAALPVSPQVIALSSTAGVSTIPPKPPVIRHYTYLSLVKPAPGNRIAAERYLSEGARAQKLGQLSQAMVAYKKAVETDPAFFEAYFNLALAAADAKNWKESLSACEHALAINPDAVNVRLCLASSLKRADYPRDAADQYEMILRNGSEDSRVHLSLAHLYAEPLNEPQQARQHYLKVLQLEPAHPQAAAIRYWLAANPSG